MEESAPSYQVRPTLSVLPGVEFNQGIPCVQRPYGGIYLITGPGMST